MPSDAVDGYILGRAAVHSVRLDAQHLLWKLHQGHLLHPDIKLTGATKVADIGTGTGLWLLHLAREVPSSFTLHGYDISDRQFPPGQVLPDNVSLRLLDSTADVPPELQGQYDVLHLRMWASNLSPKQVDGFICNLSKMLRPGGYIQWEDADLCRNVMQTRRVHEFHQQMNELFKLAGRDYSWTQTLPSRLQKQHFNILDHREHVLADDLVHLGTNIYLTAMAEVIEGIKRTASDPPWTAIHNAESSLTSLLSRNDGAVYNWGKFSVLAQKD